MAGEHSIIVRTVKYALPVTRPALLIVCSDRSLPHLLKQKSPIYTGFITDFFENCRLLMDFFRLTHARR